MNNDARMLEEVVAGRPVPEIAARYNVTPDYVERIVDEAAAAPLPESPWSARKIGGRFALSIAIGYFFWLLTGRESVVVMGLVGLIAFASSNLIAWRRP